MNFKKIIISGIAAIALNVSMLNAIDSVSIDKIDRIMNDGILINKVLKSDKKVSLTLFKALTKESEAIAILKIKNLTDSYIKVKDYVDYGVAIKTKLAPSELTYILIEDNIEQVQKRQMNEKELEKGLKYTIKNDFEDITKYISNSVNIYNVNQNEMEIDEYELDRIYINDFTDFISDIKRLDYYKYVKTNIQNSLYHGYYFTGYELKKDGSAKPRAYYFITDEITNKISVIYIINENMEYPDFKDIIMNKVQ